MILRHTMPAAAPLICALLPLLSACQKPAEPTVQEQPLDTSTYLRARVAEARGDIGLAATGYLSTLSSMPNNVDLRRDVFATTLSAGDVENAMRIARTLSAEEAPEALVHVVKSLAELQDSNYATAREHMLRARATAPNLLQFDLYRAYIDLADGVELDNIITRLVELDIPPILEAQRLYHLGRLREQAGYLDNAAELYHAALQAERGALLPTLRLANLYRHQGQEDLALEVLSRFEANNPNSVLTQNIRQQIASGKAPVPFNPTLNDSLSDVSFGFALLMWVQGYPSPAQQLLQLSHWNAPQGYIAQLFLAMLAEEQGFTEQARDIYTNIPQREFTYLAARLRLAELEHNQGHTKQAINALNELIDDGYTQNAVRQVLGDLLYRSGDYHAAIEQFSMLLDDVAEPAIHHAPLYFARGASYERLKNIENASTDLEQALRLQPDNPTVLNYLGYMWADHDKNLDQALELVARALLLRPNDGAIIDSVGWVYFKQGDHTRALKYLERAVELEPTDPVINRHLGDVYQANGRTKEAMRQWRRAWQLNPEDMVERQILKQRLGLIDAARK